MNETDEPERGSGGPAPSEDAGAPEIWTIGHSVHTAEEFLNMLRAHRVELVADVRRFPGSRRHPQFNRDVLTRSLANAGIRYAHFPELGGRRAPRADSPNKAWRNEAFRGYADYMMTKEFADGIDRFMREASRKRTALMCAEALWWQCHRALIADYLKVRGVRVWHVAGKDKLEQHPYTSAARVIDGRLSYAALPIG